MPAEGPQPKDVNFVVFRENTEGVYVSVGGRFKPNTDDEVAIQEEINTYKGVHRIILHAFEYAKANGLTKVCMADKSNAMTQGHALWQRVFKELAPRYPGITATHYYIDALAMYMVLDPGQFQVIVTNNLFGDIVTDLAATFQGGLGMAASGNIHPGQDVDVRAGPRFGAEVRRKEHCESDRSDRIHGAAARNAGREGRSRGNRCRRLEGGQENQVTATSAERSEHHRPEIS